MEGMLSESEFQLEGDLIEDVEEFAYLGSMQSKDGGSTAAVRHRIGRASAAFHAMRPMWRQPLRLHIKGEVYGAVIRGILLYGAETWTTCPPPRRTCSCWRPLRWGALGRS